MKSQYYFMQHLRNQDFFTSIQSYVMKNNITLNGDFLTKTLEEKQNIDIQNIQNYSEIFIYNIESLGNSIFHILKNIHELKKKNITLHIIDINAKFDLNNKILFTILESLLKFEKSKIQHRTDSAKETRNQKNIKLGRKEGQTIKSKYDKHKRRILFLNKQGVPNTKIVKDIQVGTPQSLGKYIKQINSTKKEKQKQKGTYMINKNDLENINNLNNI